MATLPTSAQVTEYLDATYGITVPQFLMDLAVAKVAPFGTALDAAGYTASDVTLIALYATALIAANGAPNQVQSQGAPSGASRSFKVRDNALSALRNALGALDTSGVMADAVGPDPSARSLLLVVA